MGGARATARDVWVIAHRGASADRPENTFAAFDEALRQGADGIEIDVQLSRDGVPVVYHDRTLARAGGGRRRVASLDAAELRALDAGHRSGGRFRGEPVPTLQEVLRRYGRRTRLLVEIKTREGRRAAERHQALARAVAQLIARARLQKRAMLLSFDVEVLRAAAAVAPDVPRALNLAPPARPGAALRKLFPSLRAISADVRTLTPAFAEAARAARCMVFAWTCNTPDRVARALAARVNAVMSDRPGWLAARLRGTDA